MTDRLGAIPRQLIADMQAAGYIRNSSADTLQPSSIDLRLTDQCFRMRGSYLPREGEKIEDLIRHGALFMHPLELPLETGATYLVKLHESLALPPGIHATTSSKSSSGRINLRNRLLADGVSRFDSVPAGFTGDLWLEITPKSFPVRVHAGDRLNQMRFFHGEARLSGFEHRILNDKYRLMRGGPGFPDGIRNDGIHLTVDLSADVVGWRARPSAMRVLDTAKYDHDPLDFFEPVHKPHDGEIVLEDGSFYILATKERVIVPPTFAAEMAAYDPTKGEFRSHYAGFFDPGFGWSETDADRGWQGVLEICTLGHDVMLRDGQPICLVVYERLLARPDRLYGQDLKSNYTGQMGARLAKWFKTV